MYRFVIGVDTRSRIGAEIERSLRKTYDIAEFEVFGFPGTLSCNSTRTIAAQAYLMLKRLGRLPAKYFIAVGTGTIIEDTQAGPVPGYMMVITAADKNGETSCGYMGLVRSLDPEAVAIVSEVAVELAGTEPEPLPSFA